MALQDFLLAVTLAAAAAMPAFGQALEPTGAPTNSGNEGAASVPDLSGTWVHGSIPGFEPLPSGPTSLVNRSRRSVAQLLKDLVIDWPGPGEPPSQTVSNLLELVGDYTNPILRPWAAEVVKKLGEKSFAGVGFPSPRNQCWPGGVPFVFTSGAIQILQQPNQIAILYNYDHQVRHVRLNQSHPAHVTPTWYGDSVGHFEGDALHRHGGNQGRPVCRGGLVRHTLHGGFARGRTISAHRLRSRKRRMGTGRERKLARPASAELQGQVPAAPIHRRR
jgi:hypothetical protein